MKNIVSELQGEKIDIVRYSQDIKEYIQAALSPAEISQIQLDYDGKKANIIVADDQLSLAIGKHGQNVRLASQLVGWELDLFSFDQWQEYQSKLEQEDAREEAAEAAAQASKESGGSKGSEGDDGQNVYEEEIIQEISIADLPGVGDKMIAELEEKELGTLDSIAEASVEDLTQIKGLGKIKAQKMIEDAKKLLAECEEE